MREVVKTIEELGLPPNMTTGTVAWQQRVGDLNLRLDDATYDVMADAVGFSLRTER